MTPVPDPATDPQSVLDKYVEGLPPEREALTRRLHALVAGTDAGLDVGIKYGILMYALGGDWRRWVVAIDAHPRSGVGLKFLYGVMMADERRVLRAGSSVLMTWDFGPATELDEEGVRAYVAEAVRLYPEYKASGPAILEAARARRRS